MGGGGGGGFFLWEVRSHMTRRPRVSERKRPSRSSAEEAIVSLPAQRQKENGWMDGSMQVNMTDSSQNGLDWMDGVPLSSLLLEMAGVQRDREGGTSRGVSLFLSFLYLVRHNIIIHYVSL